MSDFLNRAPYTLQNSSGDGSWFCCHIRFPTVPNNSILFEILYNIPESKFGGEILAGEFGIPLSKAQCAFTRQRYRCHCSTIKILSARESITTQSKYMCTASNGPQFYIFYTIWNPVYQVGMFRNRCILWTNYFQP